MPVGMLLEAAETSGLEVRDVENLREHYARTLRAWVRRLEASHDEVARRAWRGAGTAYVTRRYVMILPFLRHRA